jgi:hypothetical protein
MVRRPARSGIADWVCCQTSQEVCPYNIKFAQELKVPDFAPSAVLAGRDARTLAREILAMTQEEFSAAFKGSPMKRTKLRGLQRNAEVVLGNIGTAEDWSCSRTRSTTRSRSRADMPRKRCGDSTTSRLRPLDDSPMQGAVSLSRARNPGRINSPEPSVPGR